MNWTERYRPKKFQDIVGQEPAVWEIKNFIEEFYLGNLTKTKKKAIILHGTHGIGKTTMAQVIALETGSEIFELNASDIRNKTSLNEILKPATEQQSLIGKRKIILIDEVDGISSTESRGISELISIIDASPYPVIITANDVWNKKLSPLRKKAKMIKLKEVDYRAIKNILMGILKKEGKFLDSDVLNEISINARGDMRAAINDLQREASVDSKTANLDERNKEQDIFNVLKEIFKSKPSTKLLDIFDSLNMPLDEIMLWIEKNIPLEYKNDELARAFDLVSKADIFKGRIYKQQYWRFLVYENAFLSYGVSASKKNSTINVNFTRYEKPDRILKIWINNRAIEKRKSITEKYASKVHIGEKRALHEFPMIKGILQKPEVQKELKLTEEEIEYLQQN